MCEINFGVGFETLGKLHFHHGRNLRSDRGGKFQNCQFFFGLVPFYNYIILLQDATYSRYLTTSGM